MKKVVISFLAIVLMTSLVLAANGSNDSSISNGSTGGAGGNLQEGQTVSVGSNGEMQNLTTQLRENAQERRQLQTETMSNIRERMQAGEELNIKDKVILRRANGLMELREGNGSLVKTKLQLNNEGNASELKVKLNNGRNALIKIMPAVASERALERLRLKNCNETINNCTIELKEVGEGNKSRAVYEAKVRKTFRVFGIFKANREVVTQIDAETGEEVLTRRPWWSWMASEKEE